MKQKQSSVRIITCSLVLPKLTMFLYRRRFQYTESLFLMAILLCSLPIMDTSKPCSTALQNQLGYDGCRSNKDGPSTGLQAVFANDISAGLGSQILGLAEKIKTTCPDSNLFCFRSILPGFLSSEEDAPHTLSEGSGNEYLNGLPALSNPERDNTSWPSNCGILKFSRCRSVSCSPYDQVDCWRSKCGHIEREKEYNVCSCGQQLLEHGISGITSKEENLRTLKISDDSPPFLEISPLVLDWGEKHMYLPSRATLTIVNRHSKNKLSIDEPYSTNSQFYPYNFSEIQLAPGEAASITLVFLPLLLGLSSAQLVLQTSFGGFLIHCTGFALESPYGISSLIGLEVSSDGKSRKNISLSNPFNEALYVEEVISWISVSSGNSSQLKKEVCNVKDQGDFSLPNFTQWIEVKSEEVGLPVISMRPHRNWEIRPQAVETILELDLSFHSKGKVFGVFCMQLLRSSGEKIDTVVVPLEAELHQISTNDNLANLVSVSLQAPVPHDSSVPDVVIVSLRNDAPYVLRVVKISEIGESRKHFHIKYMEGLILFPDSETQVALVKKLHHHPTAFPDVNEFCELVIVTNDTRTSQVKIPCEEVFSVWSSHKADSSVGYWQYSRLVSHGNARKKYSGSEMQQQQLQNKVLNSDEGDELILKSWKSHATSTNLSVLDHYEVIFPVVQVGGYWSQFITVKNPTSKPVVMQLILNSGEIVDKCDAEPEHFRPSSSSFIINNKSMSPSRYGFSMVDGALTEAFVLPDGRASLGPIFFQPSNRCEWSSSLVIRNNLSGVEWLPLRGFGGLLSLVLLEESKPVQALDFKLTSPSHIYSASGLLYHMQDGTHACFQPILKELYAKNMGDLPLEVKRIEVSGTECGLDGFVVENCQGFALQPGESVKLEILYKTDFSTATVQRDLELILATGIIVIPMKASIPVYMLDFCKRSIFRMRLKKFVVVFILVASVCSLVFRYFLPYATDLPPNKNLFKSEKSSLNRCTSKSSPALSKKNNHSRFASPVKMNGLSTSVGEDESLQMKSLVEETTALEQYSSSEQVKCTTDYDEATETALSSSPRAHSVALESYDIQETKQSGNLTVKIGKDKGRRKKKKRSSSSVLSGLLEVSSSHSGNSTPSSPLSPVILTPKQKPSPSPSVDQSVQTRNPSALVLNQQRERSIYPEPTSKAQSGIALKSCKDSAWDTPTKQKPSSSDERPVLLPSASFPHGGRSDTLLSYSSASSASASAISPLARAPGSNLQVAKAVKVEEKVEIEKDFTYDIWGEHIFSPLLLTGRSKEVVPGGLLQHSFTDSNNSNSFFVRGPQTLMTKAQSESVSSNQLA